MLNCLHKELDRQIPPEHLGRFWKIKAAVHGPFFSCLVDAERLPYFPIRRRYCSTDRGRILELESEVHLTARRDALPSR